MRDWSLSKWMLALALVVTMFAALWMFSAEEGLFKQPRKQNPSDVSPASNQSTSFPRDDAVVTPTAPEARNIRDFRVLGLRDLWALYTQPGVDPETRAQAAKWISEKLGETADGSMDLQQEIGTKLLNEVGDEGERLGLARILGESNTSKGLSSLVDAVLSTRNPALHRGIIEQLGRMGNGQNPDQVAAMTQVAVNGWQRIPERPDLRPGLLSVMSGLLVKLGDPAGISLLRSQAVQGGATLAEFDNKANDASIVAMNSSLKVQGPQSVPLLAGALKKSDPTSTEFVWSGQALTSMGRPEATAALIEWAKVAPDSCAESAAAWIGAVLDSRSHALVIELAASGAQMQFVSSRVKQAVLASANKLATQ